MINQNKFVDWDEVQDLTGLSEPTIRRLLAKGAFPRKINLSVGRVVFERSSVLAWLEGKITESQVEAQSFN